MYKEHRFEKSEKHLEKGGERMIQQPGERFGALQEKKDGYYR